MTETTARTPVSLSRSHFRVWMMMVLTFVTGLLDAVGYLALDRVFTGNMTGNVVILGMGLVSGDHLPVLGPLVALIAYIAGAAIAGRLLRTPPVPWTASVTTILVVNTAILALAGVVVLMTDVRQVDGGTAIIAAVLAVVMGAQAAVARALAVQDMTTVVVTSTLTAFAGETLTNAARTWFTHRRFWAVIAICGGAAAGSALLRIHAGVPILVAALLTATVAVLGRQFWATT